MRHRVRLLVCAGCIVAFMTAPGGHAAVPSFFQGSVYEYVPTYTTWDRARAEAETMSFMGFPGRLATITSAAENAFIASLVPGGGNTMLGGSDAQTEGTWLWETGPEAGTIFWKDGAPFGSAYVNWRPGEPNNVQPFEDYLVMSNGQWNDSAANSFLHSGYVVEYRLTASGFDFGMTNGQAGAIRNTSPSDRLVRLDITLPGNSFFDSAATLPGREFASWSVIAASPGVSWVLPDSTATAHFTDGYVHYSISGVVEAADMSILGTTFAYSVRSVAAVPEPAASWLWSAGLLALAAMRRRGRTG